MKRKSKGSGGRNLRSSNTSGSHKDDKFVGPEKTKGRGKAWFCRKKGAEIKKSFKALRIRPFGGEIALKKEAEDKFRGFKGVKK